MVLENLVENAQLNREDYVLEVGPGVGNLTEILASRVERVVCIEKDYRLAEYLRKRFERKPNVEVIQGDVLKTQLPAFTKVVSTPPYNISSKLIFTLLKKQWKLACLVLQAEFARRLAATPGTREYSRLSVMAQHRAEIELGELVPKTAFYPKPKVDSQIVIVRPKVLEPSPTDELFEDLVRGLFNQRRRVASTVLRTYLKRKFGKAWSPLWNMLEVPPERVYQLGVSDFEALAKSIHEAKREVTW